MRNSQIDLLEERFKLQGDVEAYPKFATYLSLGGFIDAVAVVQLTPEAKLSRVENNGEIIPFIDTTIEKYMRDFGGRVERVSGMVVAALIHERTGKGSWE